jgi:hypothetical protein
MVTELIDWLKRRLALAQHDGTIVFDEEFERLFEHINNRPQAQTPAQTPAAQQAPAFEDAWAALLDTDEYLRQAAGKIRETNQRMQKIVGDLERKYIKTSRAVDDMFVPILERHFNVMGFSFQRSAEKARFGNLEYPGCYAEIDLCMESPNKALAVAVKARPPIDDAGKYAELMVNPVCLTEATIDDIREHIGQMERLRRNFNMNKDRRALDGAVAAAVFPENAADYALDQGFYVIKYAQEYIEVTRPRGGAKVW